MSTTNLPFLIPMATMGLPMQSSDGGESEGYKTVMDASEGGDDCHDLVFRYGAVQQLASQLPNSIPVDSSSAYGDYFFETEVDDVKVSIQSKTVLNEEVIDEKKAPSTYNKDGKTYNIIGSVQHSIDFDEVSSWTITLPLMLLSSVPLTVLGKVGFSAFLKPMLSCIYKGVKTALVSEVEEGITTVAIEAAAEVAAEAVEVGELILEEAAIDAALSIETGGLAMIGFVGLIAIEIGFIMLLHPSYHQLIVYNFTDYDLNWGDPELKNNAKFTMEPVTDTTGESMEQTLPAMSESSPSPFIAPVNTASMAQFNLYSDSEVHGVKWGMSVNIYEPRTTTTVTDPVGVMWDVPFGGQNSIGVTEDVSQSDLSSWVSDQEGKHNHHSRSKEVGANITVTNSIDHLQDKHKMQIGSDDKGYIYRSVLVFEQKD